MKKITSAIFSLVFAAALFLCAEASAQDEPQDNSGLNLQELSVLAKQVNDAPELEKLLNEEDSVNNLDLDGDGQTDYLRVEEFRLNGVRGFKIFDGDQEVARIEITREQNDARVMFIGDPAIYGYYYRRGWYEPWGVCPLYTWLWSPRGHIYISPWHHGYYPRWYHHYRPIPRERYRERSRDHNWRRPYVIPDNRRFHDRRDYPRYGAPDRRMNHSSPMRPPSPPRGERRDAPRFAPQAPRQHPNAFAPHHSNPPRSNPPPAHNRH